ncbi:MAG: HD domain-containing protein [Acidobacteriota bacterium]
MSIEFRTTDPQLLEAVQWIAQETRREGGVLHVVGGGVRDALLHREVADLDLELFGLEPSAVRTLLDRRFALDQVGEAFGVLKLRGLAIDVGLPRRESKSGLGHRSFDVLSDPHMSPAEAAQRRDFTLNAIAYDPLTREIIDPLGGVADLEARTLRHTSERFAEDPLRVLRGMQFVARFDLAPASETLEICRRMTLEGLPAERIFEEWRKLLVQGHRILNGLRFLEDSGWIRYFPEIGALRDCPQDPEWHPEGDVFTHVGHVLDAFAKARIKDPWEDLVVGLGCLCHDLGKPTTTVREEGRWRSKGHETAGEGPTRSLLGRMTAQTKLVESVVPLVLHHMKPFQLFAGRAGDAAIRRLALKVRIDRLVRVARADSAGRPPLEADDQAERWLEEKAAALALRDSAPQPLLQGRHLIERGLRPGPDFGPLLERCFEAQIEGDFHDMDSAFGFLDRLLETEGDPGATSERNKVESGGV